MRFVLKTAVAPPPGDVFPVFGEATFVESVAPRFMRLRVLRIGLAVGDVIDIRMRPGWTIRWVSEVVSRESGDGAIWFADRSSDVMPWPLSAWEHHHGFVRSPTGGTVIVDAPRFEVRPRLLAPVVYPLLYLSFCLRRRPYRRRFGRG
jgi:ligand-binding SRPBCC domain-containing protein